MLVLKENYIIIVNQLKYLNYLDMYLNILIITMVKCLYNKQLLEWHKILLTQIIISLNFWRYVFTNTPGETDINTIIFNALVFSIMSLLMSLLIFRLKNILK